MLKSIVSPVPCLIFNVALPVYSVPNQSFVQNLVQSPAFTVQLPSMCMGPVFFLCIFDAALEVTWKWKERLLETRLESQS